MDEAIRRYLGWIVAVLMIVTAAGSFFFRYAGFARFLDSVESAALSDSVIKAGEALPPSGNSLSRTGSLDSRMPLRATREGLVRECGGGDLLGVLMLAESSGIRDDQAVSGVLPEELAISPGVSSDPTLSDEASSGPTALDDVISERTIPEGVRMMRIMVDGIPGNKVDLDGIRIEARFRVVYSVDETGTVVSASYESIR